MPTRRRFTRRRAPRKRRFVRARRTITPRATRYMGSATLGRSKYQRSTITFRGGVLPDNANVVFKNVNIMRMSNAATSTYMSMSIIANALNNPWQATGIYLPTGWGEWSAFYNKVKVVACSIKVRIRGVTYGNLNAASQQLYSQPTISLVPFSAGVGIPAAPVSVESPYVKRNRIVTAPSGTSFGTPMNVILSNYMSSAKILGITREQFMADDKYGHQMTPLVLPLEPWYWAISISGLAPTMPVDTFICDLEMELNQYCQLYDRHQPEVPGTITSEDWALAQARVLEEIDDNIREDTLAEPIGCIVSQPDDIPFLALADLKARSSADRLTDDFNADTEPEEMPKKELGDNEQATQEIEEPKKEKVKRKRLTDPEKLTRMLKKKSK